MDYSTPSDLDEGEKVKFVNPSFRAEDLGSATFKRDYNIKYAYLVGAMYKGITSKEMIVALGDAGMLGYFGAGGLRMEALRSDIQYIQSKLQNGQPYGMNLISNLERPDLEMSTVELFIEHNIRYVEAAAYIQASPALVRYRLQGIYRNTAGVVVTPNHILAKVSRPEVAKVFLQPAPQDILNTLIAEKLITQEQAYLANEIPLAQDICVESDSGGHTDRGNALVLIPAMRYLRDNVKRERKYHNEIRVGAAGGIGTPDAVVAAFMLGADFILTGSINQCTVEAGISKQVKDILQDINVQDTDYSPAGDMFEIGAKVQVVKRGLFFPARANKLYELYCRYDSLDDLDKKIKVQIEDKYFKRSFDDVWQETRDYYRTANPERLAAAEKNPKQKMALIFRWYFIHGSRLAMRGDSQKVDYQIHCGSALGAFNQWVKGSELENWKDRYVARIGELIMQQAAILLNQRIDIQRKVLYYEPS